MNCRYGTVTVTAVLVLSLATASVAHADDPAETIPAPVSPDMRISQIQIVDGTRVCASGTAAAPGSWSMGINGARSDRTWINFTAGQAPSTAFSVCHDVRKWQTPYGSFYVFLVFQGGSNSQYIVRPGAVHGVTAWTPLTQDVHLSTSGG